MLNTRTTKCPRTGWDALTTIALPDLDAPEGNDPGLMGKDGKHILEIHTYKSDRGGVHTYASVHRAKNGWKSHMIFQDYSVKVIYEAALRCTENNVRDQHRRALSMLDNIKCDVAYHYQQLAAKQAAEKAAA